MGFLIDAGIWVDVERGRLAPADVASVTSNEPVYLSPITIAELRFGAEVARTPSIRQRRLAAINRLRTKPVLRIDETTGEIFGELAAQLRMAGKAHSHRIQDLWLASQAIQCGVRLLTHNAKDFADIPGLDLVVWPQS